MLSSFSGPKLKQSFRLVVRKREIVNCGQGMRSDYNILIEGLEFEAFHGVYPEEREKGGLFIADLYLRAKTDRASASDLLEDTPDYVKAMELVLEVNREPSALLERVCRRVLERIMQEMPQVDAAGIRISKCSLPVPYRLKRVAVEMESCRETEKLPK
jgi:dihydroneopterin aldolase